MILVADPRRAYLNEKGSLLPAITTVLDSGQYIGGKEVDSLEREFADYIGTRCAVAVGSGTEALRIALLALGIQKGDEVITVSHTAVATVAAIEAAGAYPVLVDIDPETFTLDPSQLKKALSKKTKAVVGVHLYGHPIDIASVANFCKEHGLYFIEDCAQATGAKYRGKTVGSFGDISCFSFYPTKNLGALGDGGMIATSNKEVAERAKLLREYGWKERYISEIAGFNSRLDPVQAAVLRVRLRKLDENNKKRSQIALSFSTGMKNIGLPMTKPDHFHCFHLYVVRTAKQAALIGFLKANGIGSAIHYPVPIHLQPAYQKRIRALQLPQTELAAKEIVTLPLYPELTAQEVNQVIEAINAFAAAQHCTPSQRHASKEVRPFSR